MKRKLFTILLVVIMACSFAAVGCGDTEVTVSFVYENGETVEKVVKKGQPLKDIPKNSEETGYTFSWDITDFSSIKESITVTETKTANEYKIYYRVYSGVAIKATTQTVVYGEQFVLYVPTRSGYKFISWVVVEPNTMHGEVVTDGVYDIADNLTLDANWDNV